MALTILGAYVAFALAAALWRAWSGTGSVVVIAGYIALAAAVVAMLKGERTAEKPVGSLLALLALPVLYASVPATVIVGDGRFLDGIVQGWDRAVFGTDPPRVLAGSIPSVIVSEMLHAAYLSYYAIIYVPALVMFVQGHRVAFERTVLAFTIAMTACLAIFCVFPIEGPRYAWPPPAGIPHGPIRAVVLELLAAGSSRGTAFPSSHLAIALATSLSALAWSRRTGTVLLVASTLLAVGAVYGGFHYAIDMIVGGLIGALGAWAAGVFARDASKVPPV